MTGRALHVLGSCGAWPEPGRACNGFLLEYDGFRVVLDLGYGTLPRLLELLGNPAADGLDAVVVTHRHPDHMVDVNGLFRARWFGNRTGPALPLFAGPGVVERLVALEEDDDEDLFRRVFDVHPLPSAPYRVGPFVLESRALPHFVPNAGVRLTADDLVVAYTGDTGPDGSLVELARDADLLVTEASDRDQQETTPPAPTAARLHLDASSAGRVAQEAGAKALLLTHFWPGNDRELSVGDARARFEGPVLAATEGLRVDLPVHASG